MSRSPPSEVMNITNMVDDKRHVAVAVAAMESSAGHQGHMGDQHMLTHHQLAGAVMDRSNSPHGSESSYHSGPRHTNALDALSMTSNRAYGSPSSLHTPIHTPLQAALPMPENIPSNVPSGVMIPSMQPMGAGMHMAYNKPLPDVTQHNDAKPFPCSTCGKGFARRSDLARHGEFLKTNPVTAVPC